MDSAIAERIDSERVRQCYEINRSTTPIVVVSALLVWGFFYWLDRDPRALVWAAMAHSLHFYRWLRIRALSKVSTDDPGFAAAFDRDMVRPLLLAGVVWGLLPWFVVSDLDPLHLAVVVLALESMSIGALGGLASHRKAQLTFIVPIQLGLLSRLAWLGGVGWVLAGFVALTTLVLLRFGRQHHDSIGNALRARFENQMLAERLETQIQEVARLSAEKTRFIAAASHDLRQPMHPLGLLCAALQRELTDTPQQATVAHMMRAIDSLSSSLAVMLDLSRLDAGVIEPKPRAVALARTFAALQDQFGPRARALGIGMRLRPGGHWVLADPELLMRTMLNLVDNALKYNIVGGRVHVGARRRGEAVSIEVRDSGIGVAPEHQAMIFREFFQVANPERDRTKGLGMGLAIVRRLAELQGQSLTMRSAPGRGTVFALRVPIAQPASVEASEMADRGGAERHIGSLHILLIEDEAGVLHAMRALLTSWGHVCLCADGEAQALHIAADCEQPIDLFIADLRPRDERSGIGAVAAVHACRGTEIPAMLLTGDTDPERVMMAHESGLKVVFKPVAAQDLADHIRESVSGSHVAAAE